MTTPRPASFVLLAAAVAAVVGAQPFAGGWNDGSRLAAVESLAERGTLAIDDSVFVRVPSAEAGRPLPYPADKPGLLLLGTRDKLFIDGHFYSDKSPVPTVLMAGLYRGWLALGGPTFAERPDVACRFLTVATSGAAYLFAVWCVLRLGRRSGLTEGTVALLAGSFAFATVALPYTRSVNNHVLLLGVTAGICLLLASLSDGVWWRTAALGTLAGLGYSIDLGAGPPLLVAVAAFLAWQTRRALPLLAFPLAASPWLLLHHALNYAVGGTLGPANAVPEYLAWPGSPFTPDTMTGGLKHAPGWFAAYSLDLLFGQKGIVSNNLPLWLAAAGGVRLWLWHKADRPAVLFAAGWCGTVWLLYAATSNNYGGQCCSVRWFVPFLAPGYWVLARLLAAEPRFIRDLRWLAGVGVGMTALMWVAGPWAPKMVPGLWGWMAVAGVGWAALQPRPGLVGWVKRRFAAPTHQCAPAQGGGSTRRSAA
jgi:hypothetical protein